MPSRLCIYSMSALGLACALQFVELRSSRSVYNRAMDIDDLEALENQYLRSGRRPPYSAGVSAFFPLLIRCSAQTSWARMCSISLDTRYIPYPHREFPKVSYSPQMMPLVFSDSTASQPPLTVRRVPCGSPNGICRGHHLSRARIYWN